MPSTFAACGTSIVLATELVFVPRGVRMRCKEPICTRIVVAAGRTPSVSAPAQPILSTLYRTLCISSTPTPAQAIHQHPSSPAPHDLHPLPHHLSIASCHMTLFKCTPGPFPTDGDGFEDPNLHMLTVVSFSKGPNIPRQSRHHAESTGIPHPSRTAHH